MSLNSINFETLFDMQTGFVAFLSYLWGNGAISRFISRLNQFLMLFSFLLTAYIYIRNNVKKTIKILIAWFFIIVISYVFALMFWFEPIP